MSTDDNYDQPRQLQIPPHSRPRVWFLTACNSPIGLALARLLIENGDHVVAGLLPSEYENLNDRSIQFKGFLEEVGRNNEWRSRMKVVGFDIRSIGECQSAIAEAIQAFGRIDILLSCNSEALIGTIEELAQSPRAQTLVRDQFTTNFFGPINIIKAVLPSFRECKNGHIILVTGITGHLGTPGLGMYCASQWAIEGYCDSLAYEIAPFNIKMSIVQSNIEISVLTNKITSVPPMAPYLPHNNPAPLSRGLLGGLLDKLEVANTGSGSPAGNLEDDAAILPSALLYSKEIISTYPPLPPVFQASLITETVHALLAIGGHENPPARHIVGYEGVESVKEKLKTVSEELEDFVEVSLGVDL